MESTVTVSARSKDLSIVEKAAEGAKTQYKEISGRDVEYAVNGDLSDNLCVAIVLVCDERELTTIIFLSHSVRAELRSCQAMVVSPLITRWTSDCGCWRIGYVTPSYLICCV